MLWAAVNSKLKKPWKRAEAAFRTLKTTLELRPVYHRLDERIRAHLVLTLCRQTALAA
jgi:transposase